MICEREVLGSLLRYDSETGQVWRFPKLGVRQWREAGLSKHKRGYLHIKLAGKPVKVHHVVWFIVYGQWPKQIDHINHNRADNRLPNLRIVTTIENCRNRAKSKANSSGITGVNWVERDQRWRAQICLNNKRLHLGYYLTRDDAVAARKAAERENGFHENHGGIPFS
jgi:hypothetical protein